MIEHRNFEEWVLSAAQLNPKQAADLQEHLSGCEECRNLKVSWDNFHERLMSVQVAPAPINFAERWRIDLIERKILARKMQSRRMALFSSVGVIVSFLAAVGLTLYISSPVDLIIRVVKTTSGVISIANQIRTIISSLIQVIPPIIPAIYWLVFTSGFFLLALLWVISIWRISKQGVYIK